jgi:hypothetical protein
MKLDTHMAGGERRKPIDILVLDVILTFDPQTSSS